MLKRISIYKWIIVTTLVFAVLIIFDRRYNEVKTYAHERRVQELAEVDLSLKLGAAKEQAKKTAAIPVSVSTTHPASQGMVEVFRKEIILTTEWSEVVHKKQNQAIDMKIVEGSATQYEVRNADNYNETFTFGDKTNNMYVRTDHVPMKNRQWRVSGKIINGPVKAVYTLWE